MTEHDCHHRLQGKSWEWEGGQGWVTIQKEAGKAAEN